MCVIDEELAGLALDHEPRLVIRQDRAGMVKFLDVEGASLGPRWGRGNLEGR
jgi:predicted DNA-binding WGR domain protein